MTKQPLTALHPAFADLTDPRVNRTNAHLLIDVVAIAICAVICGADRWVAVAAFGNAKHAWFAAVLGRAQRHSSP